MIWWCKKLGMFANIKIIKLQHHNKKNISYLLKLSLILFSFSFFGFSLDRERETQRPRTQQHHGAPPSAAADGAVGDPSPNGGHGTWGVAGGLRFGSVPSSWRRERSRSVCTACRPGKKSEPLFRTLWLLIIDTTKGRSLHILIKKPNPFFSLLDITSVLIFPILGQLEIVT